MQTCTPNTAETRDRTGDLQIFGLTLSQLSYRGLVSKQFNDLNTPCPYTEG